MAKTLYSDLRPATVAAQAEVWDDVHGAVVGNELGAGRGISAIVFAAPNYAIGRSFLEFDLSSIGSFQPILQASIWLWPETGDTEEDPGLGTLYIVGSPGLITPGTLALDDYPSIETSSDPVEALAMAFGSISNSDFWAEPYAYREIKLDLDGLLHIREHLGGIVTFAVIVAGDLINQAPTGLNDCGFFLVAEGEVRPKLTVRTVGGSVEVDQLIFQNCSRISKER
jgi:hypothetical protein